MQILDPVSLNSSLILNIPIIIFRNNNKFSFLLDLGPRTKSCFCADHFYASSFLWTIFLLLCNRMSIDVFCVSRICKWLVHNVGIDYIVTYCPTWFSRSLVRESKCYIECYELGCILINDNSTQAMLEGRYVCQLV